MAKLITPQVIPLTGTILTDEDALADGNEFVNSGRMFIFAKNNHASEARTIMINSQVNCNQGVDHDASVEISAAEDEKLIGPFPKDRFNDAAGKVQITYTPSTGVDIKIAVFELP